MPSPKHTSPREGFRACTEKASQNSPIVCGLLCAGSLAAGSKLMMASQIISTVRREPIGPIVRCPIRGPPHLDRGRVSTRSDQRERPHEVPGFDGQVVELPGTVLVVDIAPVGAAKARRSGDGAEVDRRSVGPVEAGIRPEAVDPTEYGGVLDRCRIGLGDDLDQGSGRSPKKSPALPVTEKWPSSSVSPTAMSWQPRTPSSSHISSRRGMRQPFAPKW